MTVYAVRMGWYRRPNGRSVDVVSCHCGHPNHFSVWSWAGHGKAKCGGCGAWILYRSLEVSKS